MHNWKLKLTPKQSFKLEIVTTAINETFTLPLVAGGAYNFTVNWGDGSADSVITVYDDADRIHTYASPGTYRVMMYGVCTKFQFNNGGDKLKVYKILDIAEMGFFNLDFYGCSNLTKVSSHMNRLKSLTTANSMFRGCTSLAEIPAHIFDNCTSINNLSYIFYGCTSLTSLPTDLFRYNTLVTTFAQTLRNCTALVSLPTDLFRYNTEVTTFEYVFLSCTSLTSLPAYLFRYNTKVTSFYVALQACTKLQLNDTIFYAAGEQATRFLNKTVTFGNCFYRTSFSGTQGVAPDLWNCNFGTGTATKALCFGGAGNSLTSLSNYGDIPVEWRT